MVFVILLITGLSSGLILFLLSNFISIRFFQDVNLAFLLRALSIAIPLTVLMNLALSVIQAYEKIGWYSFIFNILQNFMKFSILTALVIFNIKAVSIPVSYILGISSAMLMGYYVCFCKLFPSPLKKADITKKERLKIRHNVFSYSWPLVFSGILLSVFYWTDTFVIGLFKDPLAVGLYNAAVPIVLLLEFGPELFMQLFFPMINREYGKKNFGMIKQLSQQLGKWIFILNLPFFVLIFLFPGAFINLLFGKEYLAASTALRILSVGFLFSSFSNIQNRILSMGGRTKIIFIDLSIVALFNFGLNVFLISKYGLEGVAFSTTLSLILLTLTLTIQARHYLGILSIKKGTERTFLAVAVATIFLMILKGNVSTENQVTLFLVLVLFVVVYVALLFLLRCFDSNDIVILRSIKKKIFGK